MARGRSINTVLKNLYSGIESLEDTELMVMTASVKLPVEHQEYKGDLETIMSTVNITRGTMNQICEYIEDAIKTASEKKDVPSE